MQGQVLQLFAGAQRPEKLHFPDRRPHWPVVQRERWRILNMGPVARAFAQDLHR